MSDGSSFDNAGGGSSTNLKFPNLSKTTFPLGCCFGEGGFNSSGFLEGGGGGGAALDDDLRAILLSVGVGGNAILFVAFISSSDSEAAKG